VLHCPAQITEMLQERAKISFDNSAYVPGPMSFDSSSRAYGEQAVPARDGARIADGAPQVDRIVRCHAFRRERLDACKTGPTP
jgi:hypothetical protein